MKWVGVLLLLGASILTGFQLASRLHDRVRLLRAVRGLIGRFSGELAYRRISTGQMLREAASDPEFTSLPFLKPAAETFDGKIAFSVIWENAVMRCRPPIAPEEREILLEIGRILGSSDRDSQQAALSLLAQRAEALLAAGTEKAAAEGKLYRSLGVLAGLFFIVLAL